VCSAGLESRDSEQDAEENREEHGTWQAHGWEVVKES
jgi:hypothetical protein